MLKSTLVKLPGASCDSCPFREDPVVPPFRTDGRVPRLVFVGEAPGVEESKQGRPFVGKSGHLLDAVLVDLGAVNECFYETNAVMCRPPGNAYPDPVAVECCNQRLWLELADFPNTPIVVFGNAAIEAVIPGSGSISQIRGCWYGKVLPSWHPAYILRKPEDAPDFFKDMRKALHGVPDFRVITTDNPPEVVWLDTVDKIRFWLGGVKDMDVSFDFEASQVNWQTDAALMLGLTWSLTHAYIVTDDMLYDEPEAIRILNAFAQKNHLIGHNVKFDLHFAKKLGLVSFVDAVIYDTMLAHYVLDERKGGHGLKKMAREYLDIRDYDSNLVHRYLKSKGDDWSKVPPESLAQYLALDCTITLALKRITERELEAEGLLEWPFYQLVMKAHRLAFEMEELGMAIDCDHLVKWREVLLTEKSMYLSELQRISGHPDLNPNSPLQLAVIIWDERKLAQPAKKTWDKIRGQVNINPRSTSYVALFHLANVEAGEVINYDDEFLDRLFKYRRVTKILSTYVDPILEGVDPNGRFHDEVKVHGTETGRLSTFLHTIPRETTDIYGRIIKSAFRAAQGYMYVAADYSQAELRAAAAISGDQFLIDAYARGSAPGGS